MLKFEPIAICFAFRRLKIAKYYRLNHSIPAQTMRVIDADGSNLGEITKEEAIRRAREQELDLIEIAPNAKPVVARILDFKKFRYEENKKEQIAKKNNKNVELKEIWLSPRIAEHDLQTRLRRVEEFLDDDNKVMFRVKFRGREMAHMDFGFKLLEKIFVQLEGKMSIERPPKAEGRSITAIIGKNRSVNSGKSQESRV